MRQVLSAFVQPAQPLGASALARTVGGRVPTKPGVRALAAGSIVVPLAMDELQADVHLVYRYT